MANFRYFVDTDKDTIEVLSVFHDGKWFIGRHPETLEKLRVTRVIEYRQHPSKHQCDNRCLLATGRTMKCECSCGGKNHGKGT